VVPKTVNRSLMDENFDVFDFELEPRDVVAIDGLDKGEPGRTGPNPDVFDYVP
jgi:2,5-diketo-D-gluconate reductase A